MVQNNKMIMINAWNLLGFHLVKFLQEGRIIDIKYSHDYIFTALFLLRLDGMTRNLVRHIDKARIYLDKNFWHFCDKNKFRFAP
jgi:hypothetical protein